LQKTFSALTFYRDGLGMVVDKEFAGGAGVEFILPDGSAFCLAQMPDDQWHKGGGVMFAVPDVVSASQSVKGAGGHFLPMSLNRRFALPNGVQILKATAPRFIIENDGGAATSKWKFAS